MKKNKSKKTLITLGCSITEHIGWADCLSQKLNMPLVNLSYSSSSNFLQQCRFQEYVFKNNITSNDIIVWQITGISRHFLRLKSSDDSKSMQKKDRSKKTGSSVTLSKNIFDNINRVDFLSHSKFAQAQKAVDSAQVLENLLFYIIAAKKLTPNTFVVYGWDSAVPTEYKLIFEKQLAKHDIKIFNMPIVDWCHDRKLEFYPDNLHPMYSAYEKYVVDYMYPQLTSMLTQNN